jgi:CBS domain-containing protein/mannitol/fructose-specific phosphotransferase system IIA component (Ntr-type)
VRLGDLIAVERLVVPLDVETLDDAARSLRARLTDAGAVRDVSKLTQRMEETRPEDMVVMGDRAFLLHYRTDAVSDLVVALGTSPRPICRTIGEGDTQCARMALLIVAPPRLAARYLQVLGAFARLLSDASMVEAMLAQSSAEALAALLRQAEYEVPAQITVRDLMTEQPLTVSPDALLRDAALFMVRADVEGLPVVDENDRVVGMLSERELMRHLLSHYLQGPGSKRPASTTRRLVRDVMTRQVLCVSPEQPLAEVASLMTNKDVDRVPVVFEGRLIGFLTRGDIVRKLIGS